MMRRRWTSSISGKLRQASMDTADLREPSCFQHDPRWQDTSCTYQRRSCSKLEAQPYIIPVRLTTCRANWSSVCDDEHTETLRLDAVTVLTFD
jgi:hypothetical protein